MSKRKHNTRIEKIPAEPTQPTEQEPVEVEDEPILPPPIAPPVQTLEGEYIGMRAMKVEAGVYYALPAWVNVDGYDENYIVTITVSFRPKDEKLENQAPEPEAASAEPASDPETDGQ
ncbi:MAG: hypothetical protein NZ556_07855 [Fimbriimonadales bacterium]|nr:hypothetical protein [Fimbriimonadales bacterium]